MSDRPRSPSQSPELPERSPEPSPRLAAELQALYRTPFGVPAEVDAALIEAARRRLQPPRRPPIAPWGRAAAAAAAVFVIAGLVAVLRWGWNPKRPDVVLREGAPAAEGALAREDLDGSGRVDVLDAFLLARRLEADASGGALPRDWDFNADGRLDREDVAAVALVAVRLH